jgi:ADP-ribosylglycohydrolase
MNMSNKTLPKDYHDRVYAGWLGKCIGVHFGGPLESWTYQAIRDNLGDVYDYLQEGDKIFKPDDDLVMPMIMMHAMDGVDDPESITAEDVGRTWLNLLSKERGAIWRGGYGVSSEDTAYANLTHGIMAPLSGSAKLNGKIISEQIGGQIFSDIWGLVLPNNPEAAADLAEKAASVSHDGEGINGGRFVAAMVSAAFSEKDPLKLIEAGLSTIPKDSEYAEVVRDMVRFHAAHPEDWHDARDYIEENWGYDKYPGIVHIIPNAAIIAVGMLYGEGDFSESIAITNMCGWDTDCNVGNVAAVLGVALGLEGIEARWRPPLRDYMVSSSVVGSRNIAGIPEVAQFLEACGRRFAGEMVESDLPRYHFDYPGSIMGMETRRERCRVLKLSQSTEQALIGRGSLKVSIDRLNRKGAAKVFTRTYIWVDELTSNHYEACFSPMLFPGQTVSMQVYMPSGLPDFIHVSLFVEDAATGFRYQPPGQKLTPGEWTKIEMTVPQEANLTVSHLGFDIRSMQEDAWSGNLYVDALNWTGKADYELDLGDLMPNGKTVTQFTTYSGYWRLEQDAYLGSGVDFNETYTGDLAFKDGQLSVDLIPAMGNFHTIIMRNQGGESGYAFGIIDENKAGILKKIAGKYHLLEDVPFQWTPDEAYRIEAQVEGSRLKLTVGDQTLIDVVDEQNPYLYGQIGLGNGHACMTKFYHLRYTEH